MLLWSKGCKSFICIAIVLFPGMLRAQDWRTFAGLFSGTPGIVVFDLALKERGPVTRQPFMVSTAVKIYKCTEEGLPSKEEEAMLDKFSDAVESLLSKKVKHTFAGTFAHNCVRLNYYFVTDTVGLREEFVVLYKEQFPTRTLGLNIKQDKEWDTYFNFLFPQTKNYGVLKKPIILKPK